MDLQINVEQEEIKQEIQQRVNDFIKNKISRDLDKKLAVLFADNHEQARIKNNIAANKKFSQYADYDIADLGLLYKEIDGAICDFIFSDELKIKIRNMVNAKLEKYLEEATDKAAKHLANKLTFSEVNKT